MAFNGNNGKGVRDEARSNKQHPHYAFFDVERNEFFKSEKEKLFKNENENQFRREQKYMDVLSFAKMEEEKKRDELEDRLKILNNQSEYRQLQRLKEIQMEKEARRDRILDRHIAEELNLHRRKKFLASCEKSAVTISECQQNVYDAEKRNLEKKMECLKNYQEAIHENGTADLPEEMINDLDIQEITEQQGNHRQQAIQEEDKPITDNSTDSQKTFQDKLSFFDKTFAMEWKKNDKSSELNKSGKEQENLQQGIEEEKQKTEDFSNFKKEDQTLQLVSNDIISMKWKKNDECPDSSQNE